MPDNQHPEVSIGGLVYRFGMDKAPPPDRLNDEYERDPQLASTFEPDVAGLRDRFPQFLPPKGSQVKNIITTGVIALDTNAIFDLYRFNEQARSEYLAALRLLGARLWIPNRVAHELAEQRLTVVKECHEATDSLAAELNKAFDGVANLLREFGNRRGLSKKRINELVELATQPQKQVLQKSRELYPFSFTFDEAIKGDPILADIEALLDQRVGPPLSDLEAAEEEAKRRIDKRIPPGYKDSGKSSNRAIGDYLIWRQLMDEAAIRKLPITLVTNEQKPDWIWEKHGRKVGPRPELVAEMLSESGMLFHLTSVRSFLIHAQRHLGANVSESTVEQAEHLATSEPPGLHEEIVERLMTHGRSRGYLEADDVRRAFEEADIPVSKASSILRALSREGLTVMVSAEDPSRKRQRKHTTR